MIAADPSGFKDLLPGGTSAFDGSTGLLVNSELAAPAGGSDPFNLVLTLRQKRGGYLVASTSASGGTRYFAVYSSSASSTLIVYYTVQGDAAKTRRRAVVPTTVNDGFWHQVLITVDGDVLAVKVVSVDDTREPVASATHMWCRVGDTWCIAGCALPHAITRRTRLAPHQAVTASSHTLSNTNAIPLPPASGPGPALPGHT